MKLPKLRTVVALAAVTAVAVGAADAGAATPKAGSYAGSTAKGNGIKIKVDRTWGKMIVRRVTVSGTANCPYGDPPEQVTVSRLVLGGTVRNGSFHIADTDIDLRGHFVTSNRVEGKVNLKTKFTGCETGSLYYSAHQG
jgi:hypothetical protein